MTYYDVPWPWWAAPGFASACLLCLGLAGWIIVRRRRPGGLPARHRFARGYFSVTFALVCAGICLHGVVVAMDKPFPKLVLSNEGVYCAGWSANVEWSDVTDISLQRVKRKKGIDDQILQIKITPMSQAKRKAQFGDGHEVLGCNVKQLDGISPQRATDQARLQLQQAASGPQ
jgi:hypothetical protein